MTPQPTPIPTSAPAGYEYEVVEGDTLSSIASRFGLTVEQLLAVNPLADPGSLSIGQVILIPGLTPAPTLEPRLSGFISPIEGACLPQSDYLMPNAPREYRFGIHEGVDFYSVDNCVTIDRGHPVLAAAAGRVVRADHDYRPLTAAELEELLARSERQGYTDDEALDRFRGRQVWIDHGNGVITRYCHLDGIPEDVREGVRVPQGHVIGYVGDSGTPESVTNPGVEIHLHWEVWVDGSYLGKGLPPDVVRDLYEELLSGS